MRDRDAAMTHSPEPWKPQITGGGIKPRRCWAEASDGHLVCRDTEESPLGDANMEHLCACVNFCENIPAKDLADAHFARRSITIPRAIAEQVAELLKKAPDCDIILYQETLDDLAKENLS